MRSSLNVSPVELHLGGLSAVINESRICLQLVISG